MRPSNTPPNVGFLCAVGISLYLDKGLTTLENYLLNAAVICAGLVAIYPERPTPAGALTDPRLRALYENCSAVKAFSIADSPHVRLG